MDALNLLLKIEIRMGLTESATATLANRGRAQERVKLMNQLTEEISGHPEDPKFLCRLGQVAWESGMFLLASRCFVATLALDPNFQLARESLATLQAAQPELAPSQRRSSPLSAGVGVSLKAFNTFP